MSAVPRGSSRFRVWTPDAAPPVTPGSSVEASPNGKAARPAEGLASLNLPAAA